MNTQLLIVVMSVLALHVAALLGGGIALGILRLLGRWPASANGADERALPSLGRSTEGDKNEIA